MAGIQRSRKMDKRRDGPLLGQICASTTTLDKGSESINMMSAHAGGTGKIRSALTVFPSMGVEVIKLACDNVQIYSPIDGLQTLLTRSRPGVFSQHAPSATEFFARDKVSSPRPNIKP